MKQLVLALFIFGLSISTSWAQSPGFVANKGQWEEHILYKARVPHGEVYFEKEKITFSLWSGKDLQVIHDNFHHRISSGDSKLTISRFAYALSFGASSPLNYAASNPIKYYENHYLGSDSSRWKSNVPVFDEIVIEEVYPNVDFKFYYAGNQLKYDILTTSSKALKAVKVFYEGPQSLDINDEDQLEIKSGDFLVIEDKPFSFTQSGKVLKSKYQLKKNVLSFKTERFNEPSVIDPVFVFSSFSSSVADNFGFTATYDSEGCLYGGGIVFAPGYPTTLGVVQDTFSGGQFDIGIHKFAPDGLTVRFVTYLGGNRIDQPHSLMVDSKDNLVVFGVSDSPNYPTTAGAFQTNYTGGGSVIVGSFIYNGTDIILSKFHKSGKSLLGSTYFGGTGTDGLVGGNNMMVPNYGDEFRGEIYIDKMDKIYFSSTSFSSDFPTVNAYQNSNAGGADAVIAKMDSSLKNVHFSTYLGGTGIEAGMGIKVSGNNLFSVGTTMSSDFPTTSNSWGSAFYGGLDGFVSRFDAQTGQFNNSTFVGTTLPDYLYFVEVDISGDLYVLGQTRGQIQPTQGVWFNRNSQQFLRKFDSTLTLSPMVTTFGDSSLSSKFNISPTALLVDSCKNVYISGWGGGVNAPEGDVKEMYISNPTYQSKTDGSDFWFFGLNPSWTAPIYGTFFGGFGGTEHVDGGTSRFSPDGTIYQAICAGCQQTPYPTFPSNVYGPNNLSTNPTSGKCNLGCLKVKFKFDFPSIDVVLTPDTVCAPYSLSLASGGLVNNTVNADQLYWDFGNGQQYTGFNPVTKYDNPGVYDIQIIGVNLTCNKWDTSSTQIVVLNDSLNSGFNVSFDTCDVNREIQILDKSYGASSYLWDFGDQTQSNQPNPTHQYQAPGKYLITQYVTSKNCNQTKVLVDSVFFKDPGAHLHPKIKSGNCIEDLSIKFEALGSGYQKFMWDFGDGTTSSEKSGYHTFPNSGNFTVQLIGEDTVCGISDQSMVEISVIQQLDNENIFPNVFSPNEDGINDLFNFLDPNLEYRFGDYSIKIFNRWGMEVFSGSSLGDGWNGKDDGLDLPDGVYFWVLKTNDVCEQNAQYQGIVHLQR